MYEMSNLVANESGVAFNKYLSKAVDEMQQTGLKVEVQYNSVIQNSGKVLFTALILGKRV